MGYRVVEDRPMELDYYLVSDRKSWRTQKQSRYPSQPTARRTRSGWLDSAIDRECSTGGNHRIAASPRRTSSSYQAKGSATNHQSGMSELPCLAGKTPTTRPGRSGPPTRNSGISCFAHAFWFTDLPQTCRGQLPSTNGRIDVRAQREQGDPPSHRCFCNR